MQASEKAMPPNKKLRDEARECDILPGLHKDSLVSVGKLADAGYYTIFMPGNQGVQIFDGTKSKNVYLEKPYSEGGETTKDFGGCLSKMRNLHCQKRTGRISE